MIFYLLVLAVGLVSCEPQDVYCCNEGDMADMENRCIIDEINNITTPTKLECTNVSHLEPPDFYFTIVDDGRLILLFGSSEVHIEKENYCVANRTLNFEQRSVVLCNDEEERIYDEKILGYCMTVSVVFLILTLIVYSALPEMRDLQGKSIINFCLSLALGLGLFISMKLGFQMDIVTCSAQSFLIYFFLMASFFWTNAIAIQILLSLRRPTTADYGWKPFVWYALYAWGCPTLLTGCMAIVNYTPGYHRKAGIGLNSCWFFSKLQQWHYMYSVMTILLSANICIFVYTSIILWRHSFSSSHIKALRYKFVMTVRMIVILGLPWVFEMISMLSKPHIVWAIIDIFNVLQGLLIFLLLVVCRKRVIKAMARRGWLDCISGVVERHLAVGDDEEEVVHHTTEVPLQEGLTN